MEWVVVPRQVGPRPPAPVPTINVLKGAVVASDRIITVSQAYAAEICLEPQVS